MRKAYKVSTEEERNEIHIFISLNSMFALL